MTLTRQRTYSVVAGMLLVAFAIALFAAGHGKAATTPTPPPAPEVSVICVQGEDVATYREYPARTYARDLVDIRGRVDGYIERRTFDIGSDVRAGQVLYVLDVRPYEAEVERARGALAQATADIAQAEAALLKARQDVERLEPLVKEEAAVVARKATVEANRAMDVSRTDRFIETFNARQSVPVGLPSALLERRPDIRQAEQELVAANAQIGAATAEYSPRIALTGFFGVERRDLTTLLTAPARTWSAAAGAAAPIFNAGRTRATVRLAESVERELVINYERAIYRALRDVSDALAGYHKTGEQRAQQEQLVTALRDATRLSRDRYQGGLDSYLQVLDAQRNLFRSELDLTTLQRQELTSIVELYRALGGGWNQ